MRVVLMSLLCSLALVSCLDDPLIDEREIGPGESGVGMTVSFYPDVTNEVKSRTAGNAMETLRSLTVVVFKDDGSLLDVFSGASLKGLNKNLTHTDTPEMSQEDRDNSGSWTEVTKARATFRLEGIPFGR